tara:strand:+ start:709 stop:2721 length:2013 start_codon:yes stop_codon:yes gene_type:complete
MAALTGKKPKNTYKDLLQVSNSNAGIDGTLRFVSDGEGTDSTLKLSTSGITTTSKVVVGGDTAAGDDAAIGYTSAEGLIITGQGSTSDITVKNDADAAVMTVATGTTNVDIVGDVTAATVNADGDTSAGDDAAMGYTSAEGLILTGQGSTNDITIKNDADADVITVATGGTNVDVVGDLTAATLNADGDTSAGDDAAIGYTSAEGLILTGQGSTNDVTIKNDADADVITIATGGTNVDIVGDVTASTVNADGDTAAGDDAAMGYTSAEGLILTGQGSTNDVTIKNDADQDVLEIPTGTQNVTMAGNLSVAGDLTITGDDLVMSTNTSGAALIADGTNFNPVVISGDVSIGTDGVATIANDAVTLAKMAGLARGKLIYGDSSGNPAALAVGSANYVLTSDGTDFAWAAASSGAVTSYTNSTDNRVITSVNSTTINGEANLTFDGSVLAVTGNVTATGTVEPAGDTSAGDNAAIGYTSAEGLILTGQGSTNDITIKRDDDTAVLEVATGQSDIEVSGGNIIFGTAGKGVYLGVTSATAANLLDDYEEGTWTAALEGTTTNPSSAVTVTGDYTKIGNMCYVTAAFANVDTTGAAGGVRVTGMPFTQSPANQMTGNCTLHTVATVGSSVSNISPFYQGSVCDFYGTQSNAGWTAVTHNAGSGRYLYFTGFFKCA